MSEAYFKDKYAIVTGAASGIGLALSEALLAYGAAGVALADFNQASLDKQAARLAEQYPGKVVGLYCNVTKEDNVKGMISDAAAFFGGRLDLLINNAGAALWGKFDDLTNLDWEKGFSINFYGALYGCRAALPIMKAQKSGQIINIISGVAFSPMAELSMYATTKAALNALSLALRTEYWDDGIKISSATPGAVATSIWGDGPPPEGSQTPKAAAERILKGVADNDRIILGDDRDVEGAKYCFNPIAAQTFDEHLLEVARQRKSGKTNAI